MNIPAPPGVPETASFDSVALAERRLIQAGHFSGKRIAMIDFIKGRRINSACPTH
jgi:hypothetical protein